MFIITAFIAPPAASAAAGVTPAIPAPAVAGGHRITVGTVKRQTISGRFISPAAQQAVAQAALLERQAQLTSPSAAITGSSPLRVAPVRTGQYYAAAKLSAPMSTIAPHVRGAAAALSAVAAQPATATSFMRAFDGMADSYFICPNRGCTPPDMALAASAQYVLQSVNASVAVFSTDGGIAPGYPMEENTFLGGLPNTISSVCDPTGPILSDPRAFYDPNDKRFFVSILQYDGPAFGGSAACPNLGIIWIATSVDANPAHGWYVYSFDASNGYQYLPDYPRLGFDKSTVEVSTNQFSDITGGYAFSEQTYLDKAALEAGTGAIVQTYGGITIDKQIVDTVQPVETQAPLSAQPGLLFNLTSQNIFYGQGCFAALCDKVAIFGIFDPLSATPRIAFAEVTTPPYLVPPNADTEFCTNCLETIDTRISATPVYSAFGGGRISWALGTALFNGTQVVPGVLWGEFKGALKPAGFDASLAQAGYIADSGDLANSFPATAIASDGSVFIVDDRMSRTTQPGNAIYVHHHSDSPGTVRPATTIKAGVAPPYADLPFLYPNLRYGDYSATSFDGSNVWVAAQYINGGGDWATTIAAPR